MAIGTATLSDSYFLGQSPVFSHRVGVSLMIQCENISSETPTGLTGAIPTYLHNLRKQLVNTVVNPNNFSSWLTQFTYAAAADANLVAAATGAATNYVPITQASGSTGTTTLQSGDTAAADGQSPPITTALINNAVSNAFNTFISGA